MTRPFRIIPRPASTTHTYNAGWRSSPHTPTLWSIGKVGSTATPTSSSAFHNRPPTSTAPDPTTSSARTPSAPTSFKPSVSLQSSRSPRALSWAGSSHLLPAALTPFPDSPAQKTISATTAATDCVWTPRIQHRLLDCSWPLSLPRNSPPVHFIVFVSVLAWSEPPLLDRLTHFSSAYTLLKALPRT